jgi:hypothetical protein
MKTTKKEMIQNLFDANNLQIDVTNLCFEQRSEDVPFDQIELYDEIESEGLFYVEILYYSEAMRYLMEYDRSLCESMRIADEMGYEAKDLNSELLASLLASHYIREDYCNLSNEINEILKK